MRRLLLVPLLIALQSPIQAAVEPAVHKMCLKASDYLGCVNAHKNVTASPSAGKVITNSAEGGPIGNQCPEGYAYVMDDVCQRVDCHRSASLFDIGQGHDPIIAGKSTWSCGMTAFQWGGSMRLGALGKIRYTSACPPGPPRIGWNSTCEEPYITKKKKKVKCDSRMHKNTLECKIHSNP